MPVRRLPCSLAASLALVAATVTVALAQAPAPAAPAGAPDPLALARSHAASGLAEYNASHYEEALSLFRSADALHPTSQYRIYMARSLKRLGRLASAARAYESVSELPTPEGAAPSVDDVRTIASSELAEMRPRIPALQIALSGSFAASAQVSVDGAPVPAASLSRVELDPGAHIVTASAPGARTATLPVELHEGEARSVSFVLEPLEVAPAPARPPPPSVLPAHAPPKLPSKGDVLEPERDSLSHRWRLGAVMRADIDPLHGGALFAPGVSFGVLDRLEIVASALFGRDVGFEPSLKGFLLTGAWKPLVEAAVPVFVVNGPHAGIRGAAGIQWDFHRHFGAYLSVGGAYFPAPPVGYDAAYFLPSVGVQGRL